ncbi:MAG TPA: penicillin-binding protein 2 [Vicinamibacterales bacterium]|nr:penicillin-binding protein 2 [Vicinamibacterales bacterium]
MAEDRRKIGIRLTVLQYLITGVFSVLAVGFWALQVVQHAKFEEMAENNHQRTLPLRAPRGIVFDRDGKILVENRHSYSISIDRERTKDLNRTVRLLAGVLGLDESAVRAIVDRHRREPTYRPITILQDASLSQVAAVTARRLDFELPGVVIEQVPTRSYPEEMAAHVFGYVGEVNDAILQSNPDLKSGDIVGQSGIEKIYNTVLMGQDGTKRVVVNSVGREIRTLDEEEPTEGKRLKLTIDSDLQKSVEDAFDATAAAGLTNAGAAVVLDPATGEILAFTSRPAYDPNAFAAGIDGATWASLTTDDQRPLNDRAIQGRYSPGSTFKMAVALAGLEEGIITPDFHVHCAGVATFYGRPFHCWQKHGHGSIDLRHAIEQSCDVYFYTVANMVGIDKINKWATLLGLGVPTGIDLPNEVQGLVPSTEWKMRVRHEKWYAGETISVGIGQGQVSVTPVSMAVYMATLANGGTRVTPHLLKAVDDGSGWKPVPEPAPQSKVDIDPEKLQAIRDGLWMVVNAGGTGNRAKVVGKDVSGKTGSAQVISNAGRMAARTNKDLRDNGWFVFFAPRDKPTIAGVVFLEHGIHGPNAARVAHHILDTFFAKQDGRPLPPPPTPATLAFDFSDSMAKKQAPPPEGDR